MSGLRKILSTVAAALAAVAISACDGEPAASRGNAPLPGGQEISAPDTGKESPTVDFAVSAGEETLRWTDVGAVVYTILIDGALVASTTDTAYVPSLRAGVYTAEVCAYLSLDPVRTVSASAEWIARARPITPRVENGTLVWESSDGAAGYVVYKNGAFIAQIQQNSYEIAESGAYAVAAVFEDERLNGKLGEYVTARVGETLAAPVVVLEGSVARWTPVEGADGYKVTMNGRLVAVVTGNEFDVAFAFGQWFSGEESVSVTVTAYADGAEDGEPSAAVYYTA